ncbi:MAG: ATP synthase F1 subunit delta [Candidatus Kerfeldbacteria bacterium]|nr:ATP synthase F1 subunit delta [Candidatus Kerfeldbacteria bacterium]
MVGKTHAQIEPLLHSFLALLQEHRALSQADKILTAFRTYAYQQEDIVAVTATTAHEIDHATTASIIKSLESALDKKVVLQPAVDPEQIGGLKVRFGDVVVDGSIRTKLAALKDHLQK